MSIIPPALHLRRNRRGYPARLDPRNRCKGVNPWLIGAPHAISLVFHIADGDQAQIQFNEQDFRTADRIEDDLLRQGTA